MKTNSFIAISCLGWSILLSWIATRSLWMSGAVAMFGLFILSFGERKPPAP